MNINDVTPKSTAGILWPAIPGPHAASLLALQYQFEQTERWSAEILHEAQLGQLDLVLRHAYETIPYYRMRLSAIGYQPNSQLTTELFSRIPLLRRKDIQDQGRGLLSNNPPSAHGRVTNGITSGSTGRPIQYYGTELTHFYWNAFTLRDHIWHGRDIDGGLAVVRMGLNNTVNPTWGPPVNIPFDTAPSATLDIRTDIQAQVDWLLKQRPRYLLTFPTNARALALACLEHGVHFEGLNEVRTLGETVSEELRNLCNQAWGAKLVDIYSACEVGYIALQCPDHEHYHIQSENLLVEVLNSQDQSCGIGEVGRIVVTTLNNFAMPLIRYEIQDYAEVGPTCNCGRGLPVIKRILGRERNLLTLPDGRRYWPSTGYKEWGGKLPILQAQIVQRTLTIIEAKLVTSRSMTPEEEVEFTAILHRSLGYPFQIDFNYQQEIPRSHGGKFEDFISEVF